jgi:hypothetical protein
VRLPRAISAQEENFRLEPAGGGIGFVRRDPIEPEPVGTIILVPMRIIGYDQDFDGGLLARFEQLSLDELDEDIDEEYKGLPPGEVEKYAGISIFHGIYPSTGIVATPEEIRALTPDCAVTQKSEEL